MKTPRGRPSPPSASAAESGRLLARLNEAEETLRAIRSGEVDAVLSSAKRGHHVFTLQSAEQAYRVLIESMNEGALTLTNNQTVLYANQCFARMVDCPLERVMGGSLGRFLSAEDRTTLQSLLKRPGKSGTKIQVRLNAGNGSRIPVQISISPLARNGTNSATYSMVVTDMTEARRNEELLRALTHHVVQAQEAERVRMAHELHDTITQSLCALLIRSQALANKLSARNGPAKVAALELCRMAGLLVEEVESISRNLRPDVLDHLGLIYGLHDACKQFADRTGASVKLTCMKLPPKLSADTELALYRILQEALRNVEKHTSARHVTVGLTKHDGLVRMSIHDDGSGFDPALPVIRRKNGGLGLIGMRERAISVSGVLKVISMRSAGTEIVVNVPWPPGK